MKRLFAVTLLSIITLFTANVNPDHDIRQTQDIRGKVGTLRDITSTKGSEDNYCSAVKINPRIVLTAAHCLREDQNSVFFVALGQEPVFAEVFKKDAKLDLVLLKVPFTPGPYADLASEWTQDEHVYAVGFPLAGITKGNQVLTSGFLQGIYKNNPAQFLFSAPIIFGNSGGGLFNTKGELLGITVQGIIMWGSAGHIGHMNMAVNLDEIKKFLNW